ncbi:unnamed protein product [Rotaria sp. Silwood1]|nr:unnamed protein product [Rotaria sp. Silwood1]
MTVLNVAMAQTLKTFKVEVDTVIAKGEKKEIAIMQVIQKYIVDSKKVLFEGDGYSDAWHQEAAKRGLPNLPTTPLALDAMVSEKAFKLYENNKIYSHTELEARYEIELEKYIKKVQIEARVMGDLALNHIIPSAVSYQNKLLKNINGLKAAGLPETAYKSQLDILTKVILAVTALFFSNNHPPKDTNVYNQADTVWIIVATALVFLMTPALAFFYGGMVHRKNVLSTMIKSVVAAGVVSVLWVVVGYSLCFGESINGIIGNPFTHLFFKDIVAGKPWSGASTIPLLLFSLFQLMFAIITPVLFSLLVYAPLAHWSWHPQGFLAKMGCLDFAGGTVVHISAGCAALAGALVLKRRKSHLENKEIPPANIPYVLIGTGLLWFGWFGFNAGSALAANTLAVSSFATTNTAAAAAGLSWMFFDVMKGKKPSVLGFCIGAVKNPIKILWGMVT